MDIYIPIWLDLLLTPIIITGQSMPNLHSNMVRFIIMYAIYDKKRCC